MRVSSNIRKETILDDIKALNCFTLSESKISAFVAFIDEIKANGRKRGTNRDEALSDAAWIFDHIRGLLGDYQGTYFWTERTQLGLVGWIGKDVEKSPIIIRFYHARPDSLTFYHRKQKNKGSK